MLSATDKSINCKCNHTTLFSGGFMVQPNTIDWSFVFANIDFLSNPTLYVCEILTFIVFIIAVIWARRKDSKDLEKVNILSHKEILTPSDMGSTNYTPSMESNTWGARNIHYHLCLVNLNISKLGH